ncbi:hypothetical protein LINPERPRIM_LOCUS1298 [Linum perenne]
MESIQYKTCLHLKRLISISMMTQRLDKQ